jgi:glc operon protein GlcG
MQKTAALLLATTLILPTAMGRAEQVAERKALTLEGAKAVVAAAESDARRRGLPVVIVVVDDSGNLMLLERLDTTQVGSIKVGIGKARTAAHFKRPTRFFEEQVKSGRIVTLALDDFTPLQGGVPIVSGGQFVGAIGVSGDSPQVDEEIALVGAAVVR